MDNESTIKSSDPCYGSEADNKKKREEKNAQKIRLQKIQQNQNTMIL